MTLTEAAAILGVTAATLRQQIAKGKLKARKVGRDWTVTPAEVKRYGQEHKRAESVIRCLMSAPRVPSVRESLERLGLPQTPGRIPPEVVHPSAFAEDWNDPAMDVYDDIPIRTVTTPDGQVYTPTPPSGDDESLAAPCDHDWRTSDDANRQQCVKCLGFLMDRNLLMDQSHHRACIDHRHPYHSPCFGYDGAWNVHVLERLDRPGNRADGVRP